MAKRTNYSFEKRQKEAKRKKKKLEKLEKKRLKAGGAAGEPVAEETDAATPDATPADEEAKTTS
jgi:hypothetical protein